jgi:hypothetical protein
MNGLMLMKERNRAARTQAAALVITLFVLLLAVTTTAQAQAHAGGGHGAGKVILNDIAMTASVGVARGQLIRISFRIPTDQAQGTSSGKLFAATTIGVFNAVTGAKIKSFEILNPKPGIHTLDIGGSGDDVLIGGPNADQARAEVIVKMDWLVHLDRSPNAPGPEIFPPALQVVDRDTGRTTAHVSLVKTGAGTVLLTNPTSY